MRRPGDRPGDRPDDRPDERDGDFVAAAGGEPAASRVDYLAYGSNLYSRRLMRADRAPGARLVGTVALAGWELELHKRSWRDGSGKCDIVRRAGATVYGAVYSLPAGDKAALDAAEGVGKGYEERQLRVTVAGEERGVFTYTASASHVDESLCPFDWYLDLVVAGAREHGFPAGYLRRLERIETRTDPDAERARAERAVLRPQGPASATDGPGSR